MYAFVRGLKQVDAGVCAGIHEERAKMSSWQAMALSTSTFELLLG